MATPKDGPHSPATRVDYERAWVRFARWSRLRGDDALPASPSLVIDFLSEHALRLSASRLRTFLDAVADQHEREGYPSPVRDPQVDEVWEEVRRLRGERDRDRESGELPEETALPEAFLTPRLKAMLAALPDDLLGHRDRLALLAGAAGSLSRVELVSLEFGDIEDTEGAAEGGPSGALLRVHPATSEKGDEWMVRSVRVAEAAVPDLDLGVAYERWIEASRIGDGPLLRGVDRHGNVSRSGLSTRAVGVIVQRAAERASLESDGYVEEVQRAAG